MFVNEGTPYVYEILQKRKEWDTHPEGLDLPFRDAALETLYDHEYITQEEKAHYVEGMKELPKTRKDLVVAYFCKGIFDSSSYYTISTSDAVRSWLCKYDLRAPGRDDYKYFSSLEEALSPEDLKSLLSTLSDYHFSDMIRTSETFVDAKRKRLLRFMLKGFEYAIALELLEEDKTKDYSPITYLKDLLKRLGYRFNAKTMNSKDKECIEGAARIYLSVCEYLYLSGIGEEINKKQEAIPDDEIIHYENMFDELIGTFGSLYVFMELYIPLVFNLGSPTRAMGLAHACIEDYFTDKESAFNGKTRGELLSGSKFNYLLNQDSVC